MIFDSIESLSGFLFVTIASALFVISAGIRARKNWMAINDLGTSPRKKTLGKLGLLFDGIILIASTFFYLVFIFNIGR